MAKFKIFGTMIGDTPVKKRVSGLSAHLFSGNVSGFERMKKNLDISSKQLEHAVACALFDEAVKIMDKSQKLVPVDTGRLKGSALVKPPRTVKRPESSLSYNTEYALRQHEEHSSKSKYLERPVQAAIPGMNRRLKKGITKHAERGTKVSSLKTKRYG
tara:strand:+ start:4363 stop:4836 length:474 start_codon:yes stop_codon:yes gene_type:complete